MTKIQLSDLNILIFIFGFINITTLVNSSFRLILEYLGNDLLVIGFQALNRKN